MSREDERHLSTADLAGAGDRQREQDPAPEAMAAQRSRPEMERQDEPLAALFLGPVAEDFRRRWDAVQIGFVDDPRQAVREADELVRQMLKNLAQTFSDERAGLDAQGDGAADGASTEKLRLALRRYRSFMQRLLSL